MKTNSYPAIAAFLIGGALVFPPVILAAEKDMMKDEKAMMEKGMKKDMMKDEKGMMKEGKDAMIKEKMKEKAGKTASEGKMTKDDKMKMDDKMADKMKMDEKK